MLELILSEPQVDATRSVSRGGRVQFAHSLQTLHFVPPWISRVGKELLQAQLARSRLAVPAGGQRAITYWSQRHRYAGPMILSRPRSTRDRIRGRLCNTLTHSPGSTLLPLPQFAGFLLTKAPTAPRYPSWRRKKACLDPLLQNLMAKESVWIVCWWPRMKEPPK